MKTQKDNKKAWVKPEIKSLTINRETSGNPRVNASSKDGSSTEGSSASKKRPAS